MAQVVTVGQMVNAITTEEGCINTVALQHFLNMLVQKMDISDEKIQLSYTCTVPEIEPVKDSQGDRVEDTHAKKDEVSTMKNRIGVLENLLKISNERIRSMQCEVHDLRRVQEEAKRTRNHEFLRKVMDECNKCTCDTDVPEIPFCIDYSNPFNELVLGLLSNKTFLIELMKRVSCPILDKVSNWENQLQIMSDLFQTFIDKAEKEYKRLPTPEMNRLAIVRLHEEFDKFMKDFLNVVQEIQDMLDAKLDKIHIPTLKKFIMDEFSIIHKELNALKKSEECPDGLATSKAVLENLTCLTCARPVCQRTKPIKTSVFRKSKDNRMIQKDQHVKRTAGGAHTSTIAEERLFRKINLADEFRVKVIEPEITFLRGYDGCMYRAEPTIHDCTCKAPVEPCPCPDEDKSQGY